MSKPISKLEQQPEFTKAIMIVATDDLSRVGVVSDFEYQGTKFIGTEGLPELLISIMHQKITDESIAVSVAEKVIDTLKPRKSNIIIPQ